MKLNVQLERGGIAYRLARSLLLPVSVAVILMFGQGCASIMNQTSQDVEIVSIPPGVEIAIYDGNDNFILHTVTPDRVELPRDGDGLRLVGKKKGYKEYEQLIRPHVSAYTCCNVVGVYLAPVFFLIDMALDSPYYYDDSINFTMVYDGSEGFSSAGYYDSPPESGATDFGEGAEIGGVMFRSKYSETAIGFAGGNPNKVPIALLLNPGTYRVTIIYDGNNPQRRRERAVLVEVEAGRWQTFDVTPSRSFSPARQPRRSDNPYSTPVVTPRNPEPENNSDDTGDSPFLPPVEER